MKSSNVNEDIAYFIGVLHTDASIFDYTFRGTIRSRYSLEIGEKSIPMLNRIRQIFNKRFNRSSKMRIRSHLGENPTFLIELNIKNLKEEFHKFKIDKNKIPIWIQNDKVYFCAYLAGVIDGDGDIRIKRPKYPQCQIRITAGERLSKLMELIQRHLNCSCGLETAIVSTYSLPRAKSKFGIGYRHYFYVSPKNIDTIKRLVYPLIQIKHKREKLRIFSRFKLDGKQSDTNN